MNPNEASANKNYNITTNGLTVLLGKFVLVRIVINTAGASSNTATIYDSNADIGENGENKIGKIDTTSSVRSIEYGLPMFNGIMIRTETGTSADITVIYAKTP